ncbi:MAG: hypothetical protein LBM65_02020 [Oscillospiraceae bacterium]|jgi:phage gp45-like|nr:hypothetical protein [Oscillospiraceae bacterium]
MWLPNYIINSNQNKPLANRGKISAADGENVSVSTFTELRELPVVAPYGVAYCPPVSETSVVLPIADGNVCLGVFAQKKELMPGELMLFSHGGAYIHLKNNGKVIINGQEF